MNIIRDLQNSRLPNGLTLREDTLLRALKLQATTGILMTNPRVTGYSSFAKAVIAKFNLGNNTPKTCKKLYQYLIEKGYYER